jgi:hypothetical protein
MSFANTAGTEVRNRRNDSRLKPLLQSFLGVGAHP